MLALHLWSIWSIFNLLTDHASPALAFPNNNPNTITTVEKVIVEIYTAKKPVVVTLPQHDEMTAPMPISALSQWMVTSYVTTDEVIIATEPEEPLITPAPSIAAAHDFGALKTLTINQNTLVLVMKEGQKVGLPTISPSHTRYQNSSSTSVSSTTAISNATAVDKKDIGILIGLTIFMIPTFIIFPLVPGAKGLGGILKVLRIDDKLSRRLDRYFENERMDYAEREKLQPPADPLDDNNLSGRKPLYPKPKPVEEIIQNMVDVRDPTTRSADELRTVADVESFLLKCEREQPGGTFTKGTVDKITSILGPSSTWIWQGLNLRSPTPEWILKYDPFNPQEVQGMQEDPPRRKPKTENRQETTRPSMTTKKRKTARVSFEDPPSATPQQQSYPSRTAKRTRQVSFADETVRLTTYPSRPMPTRTEVPTQRRKNTRRPAPPREPEPTREPAPTVTVATQPPCAPFTYVDCCVQVLGYITKCFGPNK